MVHITKFEQWVFFEKKKKDARESNWMEKVVKKWLRI